MEGNNRNYLLDDIRYGGNEIFLPKWENFLSIQAANVAASSGRIQVLEYILSKGWTPTTEGANEAASNGHVQVLEILKKHDVLPDIIGLIRAARNGHVDSLEWMENNGIKPNEEVPFLVASHRTYAGIEGRKKTLQWLESRGFPYKNIVGKC